MKNANAGTIRTPPGYAAAPRHIVITLHGIRTHAPWQRRLDTELANAGFLPVSISYGYFLALRLLLPNARRRKVDWFRDEYASIKERYPGADISIIAHSFGTYLVANAMRIYPQVAFDSVIFCGAIVEPTFPWEEVASNGQVKRSLNEHGGQDIWTASVARFVRDAGPSGYSGFTCDASVVTQRSYPGFRHSDYFNPSHYQHTWIPFLAGRPMGRTAVASRPAENALYRGTMVLISIVAILGVAVVLVFCEQRNVTKEPSNAAEVGTIVGVEATKQETLSVYMTLDPLHTSLRCLARREGVAASDETLDVRRCSSFGLDDQTADQILYGATRMSDKEKHAFDKDVLLPCMRTIDRLGRLRAPEAVDGYSVFDPDRFFAASFYEWKQAFLKKGLTPSAEEWRKLAQEDPTRTSVYRQFLTDWIGMVDPYFRVSFNNLGASPIIITTIEYVAREEKAFKALMMGAEAEPPYVLRFKEGRHSEGLAPPVHLPPNSSKDIGLVLLRDSTCNSNRYEFEITFASADGKHKVTTPKFSVMFYRDK